MISKQVQLLSLLRLPLHPLRHRRERAVPATGHRHLQSALQLCQEERIQTDPRCGVMLLRGMCRRHSWASSLSKLAVSPSSR